MPQDNFVIGVDLGMTYDHSTMAVVRRRQRLRTIPLGDQVREDVHDVVGLHRWALGTPYRQVIGDIGLYMEKNDLKDAVIVLDATGPGKEVALLFLQAHREGRLGHFWPRPYIVTGGREITSRVVPKRELISKLLTLLESDRLKIADELPLGPALEREFITIRVKPTPTGQDSYEAARERDHDDILFAVMLGCWFRHNLQPPRMLETAPIGA